MFKFICNVQYIMRSFQKINKEKKELEKKSIKLFTELNNIYRDYLKLLGSALNKQLILAVYQICTHIYPESFLRLSNDQRREMQEKIRELCNKSESELLSYVTFPQPITSKMVIRYISKNLFPYKKNNMKHLKNEKKKLFFANKLDKYDVPETINPEDLVKWCGDIEQGIQITLNGLSQEVNNKLKKNKIISNHLPSHLLEVTSQVEEKRFLPESYPNILNLQVEENVNNKTLDLDGKDSREPSNIKISTLYLKLSDIEFNDSQLSFQRKKINQQVEKLNEIEKNYQKIKKEYTQSKAESLWELSCCD